jgi:hypothetical protein
MCRVQRLLAGATIPVLSSAENHILFIRVGILGYIAKILHEVEMALIDLPHPSSLLTDLTRISSTSAGSDGRVY